MNEIFRDVEYEILKEGKKFEIKGIEYDSRKIKEDFIFVAMAGNTVDGHNFIQKAIDSGAKIIITEKNINIMSGTIKYLKQCSLYKVFIIFALFFLKILIYKYFQFLFSLLIKNQ